MARVMVTIKSRHVFHDTASTGCVLTSARGPAASRMLRFPDRDSGYIQRTTFRLYHGIAQTLLAIHAISCVVATLVRV